MIKVHALAFIAMLSIFGSGLCCGLGLPETLPVAMPLAGIGGIALAQATIQARRSGLKEWEES